MIISDSTQQSCSLLQSKLSELLISLQTVLAEYRKNLPALEASSNDLIDQVLSLEVQPAWGCTEPSSVALATCLALSLLRERHPAIDASAIESVRLELSASVFKNGLAVGIPYTGGMKGLRIAAALGLLVKDPSLQLGILKDVGPEQLAQAKELVAQGRIDVQVGSYSSELRIQAVVSAAGMSAKALIEGNHTNVREVTVEGQHAAMANTINQALSEGEAVRDYRRKLSQMQLQDLIAISGRLDRQTYDYVLSGIQMNLELAALGLRDPFAEILFNTLHPGTDYGSLTAFFASLASYVRMAGIAHPAMSSGGSGNQGILATLLPLFHAQEKEVEARTLVESILMSHLINSYVKCYLGELSPICGCAIGAGLGACAAIVYQRCADAAQRKANIAAAISNLTGDLAGVLCDGAKPGCALKVGTAAYAAAKAAELALQGYSVEAGEGIVGSSVEQTIRNLGRIGREGMCQSDKIVLSILENTPG